MTEARESREPLDAFNPNFDLSPINLEDAYEFASLLFSPSQPSIEPTVQPNVLATSLYLLNTIDLDIEMSRMRGQVAEATKGPRSRKKFDKTTTTPLQIWMQNKRHARLEELDWSKQWKNFTEWGMENGCWKPETESLAKPTIRHMLVAPQVAKLGRWKEEAAKFILSRFHQGYIWLNNPIAVTGGLIH